MMLPPGASQADMDRLRALYGLDKSIPAQFFIWIGQVLHGDFGISISLRENVMKVMLGRLPATLELCLLALTIALLLGGTLAVVATRYRGTAAEIGIDVGNGIAFSVPDFLWGLTFILAFGVAVPIFAISGRVSPTLDLPFTTGFYLLESIARLRFDLTADLLNHMLMPALALALPLSAVIAHVLKTSLKEVMLQIMRCSRARGFLISM